MATARVIRALPPVRTAVRGILGRSLQAATAATAGRPPLWRAVTAAATTSSFFHTTTRTAMKPTRSSRASDPTPDETAAADSGPLPDAAATTTTTASPIDWSSSFHGLSTVPFSAEVATVLTAPVNPDDVEIKPDGILYLPEIKYRRILQAAFGPGGWGMAPRGELAVGDRVVSREYALVAHGRYVGEARGECPYFNGPDGVATAGEGCKSNALVRCCKDLGVASELWDPRFIRDFKHKHCREVWVEHVVTKKRRQIWLRRDAAPSYPFAVTTSAAARPPASAAAAKTTTARWGGSSV